MEPRRMTDDPVEEPPQYVAAHVRDWLADDERLASLDIRVRIMGRKVFLSGTVATDARRGIVTDVVAVSASGTSPVPPLELSTDPALVLAGLALLGLVGAAIVLSTTRAAFREGEAGRPKEADA